VNKYGWISGKRRVNLEKVGSLELFLANHTEILKKNEEMNWLVHARGENPTGQIQATLLPSFWEEEPITIPTADCRG